MDGLITINYDSDRPTTSARDLHEFLEVGTAFKDWFPRMAEYGFSEGIDFNPLKFEQVQNEGGREVKRELIDYQLTVAMAKEISMIQRNEKGKRARTYFIQIEEAWNTPESVMSRALKLADQRIHHLSAIVEQDKPKVLFANSVSGSHTSILIRDLSKLLNQNGIDIGEKRLFEWLRANGYLIVKLGRDYNSPSQKSMNLKLMEIKESAIVRTAGTETKKTTLVTGKGQLYFINKFLGEEV